MWKYSIKNKLISCHEYNESKLINKVIDLLKEGKNIGLVTDQGTPIISDPGYIIVKAVINNSFPVVGLPGATAFIPALITSNLDPSPFLFFGFLNAKKGKQKQQLEQLKSYPYTMIFYEAPHRIVDTLNNMLTILGNRKISLAREISKLYEEIYRGTIEQVLQELLEVKGEIVLVVEGNKDLIDYSNLSLEEHINLFVEDGLSQKEAIKRVAKERNLPKSFVYKEFHTKEKK